MRLLIVGPQGAGKGTQAALLADSLGIPHVSTGDLFRANLAGGTELGMLAKKYMDAGELVPDEVTQEMVADRVAQPDAERGFLLDGFPRNVPQADWLNGMLEKLEKPIEVVVLLTAPDEVLLDRMLARGRADDTVDAISRRLDIYHRETKPLIEYYDGRVVHVDGVGEIDEVHDRVLAAVRPR
jgi:adenylate kinase